MADQKFYSLLSAKAGIKLSAESISRALELDASGNIKSSAVTSTELGYISGLTSSIQTQLNAKASQTDLDNHINDAVDAHDASAISSVPSGNLAASTVQAALNELQGDADSLDGRLDAIEPDITDLITLSGVAANAVHLGTFSGSIIPDSSTVKAAIQSLETSIGSLPDPMEYKGQWNASTNSPSLVDGAGNNGDVYHVATAGSQFSPAISFDIGDKVVYNGASGKFEKWDMTDSVSSVFGRSGAVTAQSGDYTASQITNVAAGGIAAVTVQAALNELDTEKFNSADFNGSFDTRLALKSTTDLAEGSNLYFSDERAQDAVGAALTDSSSIDFTYNDGAGTISAVVLPAAVDHNLLLNFSANKHIDHSAVSISTGAGLTGGGDITATRTLSVDISGTTAETSADNADSILIYDNSASALRKMTRSNFLSGMPLSSAGDLNETSFAPANNQAAPASVTGLAFANGVVRSFKAQVSIAIDATADLFEVFELSGIQKGASWDMSVSSVGDDSGLSFSITNAGQVQYTSTSVAGHVSSSAKFRASTTSI